MSALKVLPNEPIIPKKPPVDPSTLAYKDLLRGPVLATHPRLRERDARSSSSITTGRRRTAITSPAKLLAAVQELVPAAFIEDAELGFKHAPMSRARHRPTC